MSRAPRYWCCVVGVDVVTGAEPSPKFQVYEAIPPTGDDDADPSNAVGVDVVPAVTENAAVGAWSGVMARPSGPPPTVVAVPTCPDAVTIGTTRPPCASLTYAVAPSGVNVTAVGLPPTAMAGPAVPDVVSMGTTVPWTALAA